MLPCKLVQILHLLHKLERQPFSNAWNYGIVETWCRGHLQWRDLSTKLHNIQWSIQNVRFQVLTAASMMFRIVFWDVLPCKMIVERRFRGPLGSLMMKAVRTSETSVDNHFTRQYIPVNNSEHRFKSWYWGRYRNKCDVIGRLSSFRKKCRLNERRNEGSINQERKKKHDKAICINILFNFPGIFTNVTISTYFT
jgi:hypothetical protein